MYTYWFSSIYFHQGSLGGVAGVLFARPFAFRTGFFIWPWTFFLFILSAIASGPAFTALVCRAIEKVSGKQLVDRSVYDLFGKIVATLLSVYMVLKIADTLYWIFVLAPSFGFKLTDFYLGPTMGYGCWWPRSSSAAFFRQLCCLLPKDGRATASSSECLSWSASALPSTASS